VGRGQPYDHVVADNPQTYGRLATPGGLSEVATYSDGLGPPKDVTARDPLDDVELMWCAWSESGYEPVEASTFSGTSISRFRILPVGPLGSSSTNQTLRGYL